MPRKKKGSPARIPSGLPEGGSRGIDTGYRPLPMASNFLSSTSLSSSAKEDILRNMQEMFSHLDPEVIYIVLSECDFRVENAMDSLLELAAAGPEPVTPSVSGFERTAAELLSPQHFTRSQTGRSTSPNSFFTEDMDFLIDQEVQSLSVQEPRVKQLESTFSFSSCSQQKVPEPLQSNLKLQCSGLSIEKTQSLQSLQMSGSSSPLDELSVFGDEDIQQVTVLDKPFTTEPAADKNIPSADLASGRPSAFQVYTKHTQLNHSLETTEVMASDARVEDSISNSNRSDVKIDSSATLPWNIKAPVFCPQAQAPVFITPVASNWPPEPRPANAWYRPLSHAPLRPCAAIPKSWTLPPPQPPSGQNSRLCLEGKVLVLLRGAPGSGKSTLARALLAHNPGGIVLSTDEYFKVNGNYHFNPAMLGEAHSWNHNRAEIAFESGVNPIVIDNTNLQAWEMRPYVVQALKHNYKVLFKEPDTWWKNKARELERRTKHGVPVETIRRMLCGYDRYVTVKSIMGSQMPEQKHQQPADPRELPLGQEVPCPDLVGESAEKNNKSNLTPGASLPDISTTHDSNYFRCADSLQKKADIDMSVLESELDKLGANQGIPDCIVESVINVNHPKDQLPVAFSESIGQRVKRERAGRNDGSSLDPVDLSKEDEYESQGVTVEAKMVDFEGDWPTAGSFDQRQVRKRERQNKNDIKTVEENDFVEAKTKDLTQPDVTELHNLDLIQIGVASSSSSLSENSVKTECRSGELQRSQSDIGELPDCVSDSKAAEMVIESECDIKPSVGQSTTAHNSTIDNNEAQVKEELCCGEMCESHKFESIVETEISQIDDVSGSQEPKQRHIRRSGKQCKLALTFTQNCRELSVDSPESSAAVATIDDGPGQEFKSDLCSEIEMKSDNEAKKRIFTQTESQDFALLWRVNHQVGPNTSGTVSDSDISVLCGDPTRFVPEPCPDTDAAIQLTNHKEVPYSVVNEKGTQVEEKELGKTQDCLEILRRHFKLVTLDTLEDLYEKCQQDLEWTTNLLLDSGEQFFMDDEEEEQTPCLGCENDSVEPCYDVLNVPQAEVQTVSGPDVVVEEIKQSSCSTLEPCRSFNTNNFDSITAHGMLDSISVLQEENVEENDAALLQTKENVPISENGADLSENSQHRGWEGEVCGGITSGAEMIEGEIQDDLCSMGEIERMLQAELKELEREEKHREEVGEKTMKQRRTQLMEIKSVELRLPTELALQLSELFGPVGVDPETDSPEDYVLQMDLNLAKLLHQKWKDSVQERQKHAALSLKLLQENSAHWSKSQQRPMDGSYLGCFRDGTSHLDSHPGAGGHLPFMDHWNVSRPHVSLRDIIKEELALQQTREKAGLSQADLEKRNGATLLKEEQLLAHFPSIDRHFLLDIFRDHNYSLTQTELFLQSLLGEEAVKTVVAPEAPQFGHSRAASKDRDKKPVEPLIPVYQDTEDPEYQDFRAEANLQRKRQLESFAKASEAYKQGHGEVASFYAQQGHLHGQRMREANHRAAVQIFERVNATLLPNNVLDLHGLHVEEALEHLTDFIERKTTEFRQGHCRPQLSIITGIGNHSQWGVARIRPAVLKYLKNNRYRFTEPNPGLLLVSLK